MLFRMGGDEFTVLLEDVRGPEEAAMVASRVLEAMAEPLQLAAPRDLGHREHRHRALSARRRGRRAPAEERRHRDVPRQGARPQPLRVLRAGDERARREPDADRGRAAPRAQEPGVRAAFPAAGIGRERPRDRRRGAAALAPPGMGAGGAGALHPAAGGDRHGGAGRRLGAGRGLPPRESLAGRRPAAAARVGEPVVAPVPQRDPVRLGDRGAARQPPRSRSCSSSS